MTTVGVAHRCLRRALAQSVDRPRLESVFGAVGQITHRRGPGPRTNADPVAELPAALLPAVFVADDRGASGVRRGIPPQRHLAVAGARPQTDRRDRRRHPRRRDTDFQSRRLVRFVPGRRPHRPSAHRQRQRVVVCHPIGPGRHRSGEHPVVDRIQSTDPRVAEHRVVLIVAAGRILTALDVVAGKTCHRLGIAEPHRKGALHRRRKVARHLNRQRRDGHPLLRLRPVACPLVVGGPQLHFIDRARFQVIQPQREPRPLVLTVDEAPRALLPVLHVVVADRRACVCPVRSS